MYLGSKQFSFGEMVIAYVAGMLFGALLALLLCAVPAEAGVTMNYQTKTVRVTFWRHELEMGEEVGESFPCLSGWKWEAYMWKADPENPPAFVPVLLEKGNCDANEKP